MSRFHQNRQRTSDTVRMEKREPSRVGSFFKDVLRSNGLAPGMNDFLIRRAWDEVTNAAGWTLSKTYRDRILYVRLSSSALRTQLNFQIDDILEALNKKVKEEPFYTPSGKGKPVEKIILQ